MGSRRHETAQRASDDVHDRRFRDPSSRRNDEGTSGLGNLLHLRLLDG